MSYKSITRVLCDNTFFSLTTTLSYDLKLKRKLVKDGIDYSVLKCMFLEGRNKNVIFVSFEFYCNNMNRPKEDPEMSSIVKVSLLHREREREREREQEEKEGRQLGVRR